MSESSHLQFVDTNILIYAHDHSAGEKHVQARDLIRRLWHSQVYDSTTVTNPF